MTARGLRLASRLALSALAVLGLVSPVPVRAQADRIPVRGNASFDAVAGDDAAKMVGGVEAPANSYPWQASLQRADFMPGRGHYCGASVWNAQWILTAAHCVENLRTTDFFVTVGTRVLAPTSPRLVPSRFLIHRLYNQQTRFDFDIALIQLEQPLTLSAATST